MVQVKIGSTLKRENRNVHHATTLRQALETYYSEITGTSFGSGIMQLDGSPLSPGDLNKTFAELGYDGSEGHNKCQLLCIVKADNA